jgi:hypothetical protein
VGVGFAFSSLSPFLFIRRGVLRSVFARAPTFKAISRFMIIKAGACKCNLAEIKVAWHLRRHLNMQMLVFKTRASMLPAPAAVLHAGNLS